MKIYRFGHHWPPATFEISSYDELPVTMKNAADKCKTESNIEPVSTLELPRHRNPQWAHFKGPRKAKFILLGRTVIGVVPTGSAYGYRFETNEEAEDFYLYCKPNATIHKYPMYMLDGEPYVGQTVIIKDNFDMQGIQYEKGSERVIFSVEPEGIILEPIDGLDLLEYPLEIRKQFGIPKWSKMWFGCLPVPREFFIFK